MRGRLLAGVNVAGAPGGALGVVRAGGPADQVAVAGVVAAAHAGAAAAAAHAVAGAVGELGAVHAAAVAAERSQRVLAAGAPAVAAAEVAAGADGLDRAFVAGVLAGRGSPCTRPPRPAECRRSSCPCRPCCSRRRRCRSRCRTGRRARTGMPCSRWVRQVPLSHQRPAGQSASITHGGAQASPMHIGGGAALDRRRAGRSPCRRTGWPPARSAISQPPAAHTEPAGWRRQAPAPSQAPSRPQRRGRLLGAFLVGILAAGHRKAAGPHCPAGRTPDRRRRRRPLAADAVGTVQGQALAVDLAGESVGRTVTWIGGPGGPAGGGLLGGWNGPAGRLTGGVGSLGR